MKMNEYQVWMEGYSITGVSCNAKYYGTFKGTTFRDACDLCFDSKEHKQYYNSERLTYWGCRLFDNGNDAVKLCG